ncbi:MAG: hypothetical protein CK426_03585 [Legionella sp.]|nr:MAG: hypothetical protein CK423_05855 [Legionella sp.]PJD99099.1 MAG: hypothetical protein CK426_03585 [Legionella sp.]
MTLFIQLSQSADSWSPWISSHLEGTQFIVDEKPLQPQPQFVRAIKNTDPENPQCCWYVWHQETLYEITKNKTGFIEFATPLPNQAQSKRIAIQKIAGDFSVKAFNHSPYAAIID